MSAPTIGTNWQAVLRELPQGWDSYGGSQITEAAIDTVERFAVVPCSDGGVQLEIHQNGMDIEIYIEPNGDIAYVSADPVKEKA